MPWETMQLCAALATGPAKPEPEVNAGNAIARCSCIRVKLAALASGVGSEKARLNVFPGFLERWFLEPVAERGAFRRGLRAAA